MRTEEEENKTLTFEPRRHFLEGSMISRHPTFLLINCCKTIPQLQKLHAQIITTGLLSLYPSLLLTKILYTFTTTITNNNTNTTTTTTTTTTSCTHHHLLLYYAVSIFNQIPTPSTFSYNTIIRAHTLLSSPLSALLLFSQMRFFSLPPDPHTFPFVLKACTHLRHLPLGRSLHSQAIRFGFGHDIFVTNTLIKFYSHLDSLLDAYQLFDQSSQLRDVVSYNAMIDGFVKARDMIRARHIFDNMPPPIKDPVSWGTLLAGYAQTNQCEEAIRLFFDRMLMLGVKPDNVALVSVLSACGHTGALEQGKAIHDYIQRNGIRIEVFLSTGLVDMYAKCGCIEMAIEVFESCPDKNLFTWNAMVVGLAMHGHGELSLEYFLRMRQAGVRPDGVSFLGVLAGCSHAGLVNDAMKLFDEMESVYGVKTELKHYGCMVDLLGRAGLIKEAMEVIETRMPMEGGAFVWGGLLGGCRIHGNVEVAEIAAVHMMEIHPEDVGGVYKIMADIYANAGRWEDVAKVRKLMNAGRFHKSAAASSLIT